MGGFTVPGDSESFIWAKESGYSCLSGFVWVSRRAEADYSTDIFLKCPYLQNGTLKLETGLLEALHVLFDIFVMLYYAN